MALLISEADVSRLVNAETAFRTTRDAHVALHQGTSVNQVRSRSRAGKASVHTMSAIDIEGDFSAAKVYAAAGKMAASHVLLYRASSGELLAIIEAVELGRLRTAAASAVAAHSLSTNHSEKTLGIIGSGFQAEGVLRAYLDSSSGFAFESVFVWSRNAEHAKRFAGDAARLYDRQVMCTKTAEELVRRSALVVTATTSSEPVIEADWLGHTTHISAIGSNSLVRRELPPRVVLSAAPLVVDDIEVAKAESGNLLGAIETGKLQWRSVVELGAIIVHVEPRVPNTYSVFCSHGLAVQDLFLAKEIYHRYTAQR